LENAFTFPRCPRDLETRQSYLLLPAFPLHQHGELIDLGISVRHGVPVYRGPVLGEDGSVPIQWSRDQRVVEENLSIPLRCPFTDTGGLQAGELSCVENAVFYLEDRARARLQGDERWPGQSPTDMPRVKPTDSHEFIQTTVAT
jgi:hypothetical protein